MSHVKAAIEQYANPGFYMFLLDPVGQQTDPTRKAKEALELLDREFLAHKEKGMETLLDMIKHSMNGLKVHFLPVKGELGEPYIRANALFERLYEQSKNALPRKDGVDSKVD